MGPIALFDKSFIQSLTVDESVWFDHFFYPVVCPIFYVETLADLAKSPKRSHSAESEVRIIASKFPEMSGGPCLDFMALCRENLLGAEVPMNGRIPRGGARQVEQGGRKGYVYDQSPEDAAFQRWQAEQFYDVERLFAAQWRKTLEEMDLREVAKSLRVLGIDGKTYKSLEDVKEIALSVVTGTDKPFERLGLAVRFFNIPQKLHDRIIRQWESKGRPPLRDYAPYAAFVLTVEVFFHVAIAANLVSPDRPSNRTDVAYLFYLPFSMLFISSDKLHGRLAPIFMREDQEFVWGVDLKWDLRNLNDHFLGFPESERELGVMKFARRPPTTGEFMTTKIWERHLRPSALHEESSSSKLSPEDERKLVEELQAFSNAPASPRGQDITDESQVETMSIERRISRKKGSWWQVPKDLKDEEEL